MGVEMPRSGGRGNSRGTAGCGSEVGTSSVWVRMPLWLVSGEQGGGCRHRTGGPEGQRRHRLNSLLALKAPP